MWPLEVRTHCKEKEMYKNEDSYNLGKKLHKKGNTIIVQIPRAVRMTTLRRG